MTTSATTVDPTRFRTAMSRFPTGVTVLSTRRADGEPEVMTANAVISVSLDPALLLVSVRTGSRWLEAVRATGTFAVEVLAGHQEDHARWCADRARHERPERLADLGLRSSAAFGLPGFEGSVATIECRLHQETTAGDHVLVLGEVVATAVHDAGVPPLVFADRDYGTVDLFPAAFRCAPVRATLSRVTPSSAPC